MNSKNDSKVLRVLGLMCGIPGSIFFLYSLSLVDKNLYALSDTMEIISDLYLIFLVLIFLVEYVGFIFKGVRRKLEAFQINHKKLTIVSLIVLLIAMPMLLLNGIFSLIIDFLSGSDVDLMLFGYLFCGGASFLYLVMLIIIKCNILDMIRKQKVSNAVPYGVQQGVPNQMQNGMSYGVQQTVPNQMQNGMLYGVQQTVPNQMQNGMLYGVQQTAPNQMQNGMSYGVQQTVPNQLQNGMQ